MQVLEIIAIASSALAFPLVHLFTGWVFRSLEVTSDITLIYLPAFIRLFNVLVFGPIRGSLATLAGGLLLMYAMDSDDTLIDALGVACSVGGPLLAIFAFRFMSGRPSQIDVLRDVAAVALLYSAFNALLHHVMWFFLAPESITSPLNLLWMAIGDFNGVLVGAYCLKWLAARLKFG